MIIYLIMAFGLGLVIGSFLSMLIPRLHHDETGIVLGRSHCPKCKHTLGIKDLIPLVSYALSLGKCPYCKKAISLWYPVIEISTALTFLGLAIHTLNIIDWIWLALLFSVLLFIFFYDLRYKEIHDAVMLPAILLAAAFSVYNGVWISGLIGATIGFSFFGFQYLLSKGKWIGAGDMRIGLFMGFFLGWQNTLLALVISYMIGSIISLSLLISGKATKKTAVPLGPFLVAGSVIAFFCGTKLIDWYLYL